MAHHYQIPKTKRNPRIIHLIDIPAIILIIVLTFRLLPWGQTLDLSTGFNEKSEGYLQAESQLLLTKFEEGTTSSAYFQEIFDTSCLQNGGFAYRKYHRLYLYQNGDSGLGYYTQNEEGAFYRPDQCQTDQPKGLILSNPASSINISLTENGQVFFSDLEQSSGLIDAWVDLQEQPDLQWASNTILSQDIPYADAIRLWSLAERDILVGFDGHNAWFHTVADGVHSIHRGNTEGVEIVHSIKGDIQDVMVIEGGYLVYGLAGDLYIRCLETGAEKHVACSTIEGVGPLRQIAYWVNPNGNIRIYTLNEISGLYFDLSKTGAETGEMTKLTGLDFPSFSGLYITAAGNTVDLWFRGTDGYAHVQREG